MGFTAAIRWPSLPGETSSADGCTLAALSATAIFSEIDASYAHVGSNKVALAHSFCPAIESQ